MDSVIYNAIGGAKLDLNRQSVGSHNLANLNTTGFKQDLTRATSMMIEGAMGASQSVVMDQGTVPDLSPGTLMTTGRDLDVASIEGWFAVQGKDGSEGYTQAGSFRINENGTLTTASGQPVIGDGGPISIPPADHVEIGSDGTISIRPLGGASNELAIIDRLKLVRIDKQQVKKDAEGLIKPTSGQQLEADPTLKVQKGALMGSNVSAIDQMVRMIECNRDYEQLMKDMQGLKDNGTKLAQLLQT